MTLQMFLISTIIVPLCRGLTLGCPQRNLSCNDIKTANGFKFLNKCPEGSEIFVHYNETVIAHAAPGNLHFDADLVMSMGNLSVITRHFRELEVKCITPDRGTFVKETCVNYKLTTEFLEESDLPTQGVLIFCVAFLFGVMALFLMIWCCVFQKKELKKGTSQGAKGETEETRPNAGSVVLEVTADDLDSVISIDPRADGKTPQSLSLDCNLSNEGIQLPKNGDTCTPDANSASNYQAMYRNLRDDPGGKDNATVMHNGQTLGDDGREDQENEGQPLLSNQRAAIQGFDMTGEAAALVNKHGFDQDQVSGCSTAPIRH
ncbi:uncharacterized protein LOC123965100 isoform X2 [Micropterus dolomieu]|uniref:uncharacterized protein LOC123965100 isoform X2 n=1 Tax=Micropterus dolomieu TaxID=147949 RepID=UPI001E8DA5D0|nr:uncharacterized protein LOC123965100 isoform X2 [Micropterus dolomieu]